MKKYFRNIWETFLDTDIFTTLTIVCLFLILLVVGFNVGNCSFKVFKEIQEVDLPEISGIVIEENAWYKWRDFSLTLNTLDFCERRVVYFKSGLSSKIFMFFSATLPGDKLIVKCSEIQGNVCIAEYDNVTNLTLLAAAE